MRLRVKNVGNAPFSLFAGTLSAQSVWSFLQNPAYMMLMLYTKFSRKIIEKVNILYSLN